MLTFLDIPMPAQCPYGLLETQRRQNLLTEPIIPCVLLSLQLRLPTCNRVFCRTYSVIMGDYSCLPRFYHYTYCGNVKSLPWPPTYSLQETIQVNL
jgi:hypothetical protein